MKNITKQYQDLLEGKMSKANFMVNVRRDFPQWISPVNTFQDAVNILKSKRILTEASVGSHGDPSSPIGGETQAGARHIAKMWNSLDKEVRGEAIKMAGIVDTQGLAAMDFDAMMTALQPGEGSLNKLYNAIKQAASDIDLIHKYEKEKQGQEDVMSQWDMPEAKALNEAVQKPEGRYKEATGKVEYDKFAEMDRVHYGQLIKGTEFELLKMPEISDENYVKAKKKAYSNLIKNPKYYMHLLLNNEKDVEKRDKDLRMEPVKGDNKVDKANAMKVIKKDEGGNTQESLGNKEKAKGKPEGVKEMPDKGVIGTEKVLRESLVKQLKEDIMDEMLELGSAKKSFNKGQKVQTPEGGIGTVEECTPDNTVIIKLDGGGVLHMQGNVLKPYEEPIAASEPVAVTRDLPVDARPQPMLNKFSSLKEKLVKALMEDDPQMQKVDKDIENKEKELSKLFIQKGQQLGKPGAQS